MGGISTFYMGMPVITRIGDAAVSRIFGSILKAIGRDDWVEEDKDGYLAIAGKFGAQPSSLEPLRAGLPNRIAGSSAGDVETYTRCVEEGYRGFWRDHRAAAALR